MIRFDELSRLNFNELLFTFRNAWKTDSGKTYDYTNYKK
jgi:hypothetical protein